jgi:hypothetical protein
MPLSPASLSQSCTVEGKACRTFGVNAPPCSPGQLQAHPLNTAVLHSFKQVMHTAFTSIQ